LSCTGNDTIFTLYNISIFDDLGFANQLYNLTNGFNGFNFSIPSVFDDLSIQSLYRTINFISNETNYFENYVINELAVVENITKEINASAPGSAFYLNTTRNLTTVLDNMNSTIYQIESDLTTLKAIVSNLAALRLSLISDFFNSISFPFFQKGYFANLLKSVEDSLTDCGWIGNLYQLVVVEALCTDISPGILGVGWSIAAVLILMFLSFPVIIWSLNLE